MIAEGDLTARCGRFNVCVMSSKIAPIANERQETYETLKARAAEAGLSLPDYLYQEWEKTRPRFTKKELIERMARRAPLFAGLDAAELIRQGREERETEMESWLKDVGRR